MTGRSLPEWIGATPDSAVPRAVKMRVWERCGGRCAITGLKIHLGEPHEFDHIIPLALGGRHAESNLQLVSKDAHKTKTASDVGAIRKADRVRAKHLGLFPKPKRPLQGRGFAPSRNRMFEEESR